MAAAGRESGDGFSKNFESSFDRSLTRLSRELSDAGRISGTRFSDQFNAIVQGRFRTMQRNLANILGDKDAFIQYAAGFKTTGEAVDQLNADLERQVGVIDEHTGKMVLGRGELTKYRAAIRNLAADFGDAADAQRRLNLGESAKDVDLLTRGFDRLATKIKSSWSRMDSTVRVVLTLIASAADQIAVLGSAAGAGLVGLGGAASQAVVAVSGVVAVFSRLNEDIEDLPANIRPVAREFGRFKSTFAGVVDVIGDSAIHQMDGVFDSLGRTVSSLTPELGRLGSEVGKVFQRFAKGVKPGTDAFYELHVLINNTSDILPDLSGTLGKFATAFVRAFNGAQPLVEQLYGWIDKLANRFDAFTRGPGLDEWVGNAQAVFSSLGGLLDNLGRALNDLASPEAVQRTTDLIDGLADLTPALGAVLDVVGRLDLLGILVDALGSVLAVVEPLTPALGALADVVGAALKTLINPATAGALLAVAGGFALIRGANGLGNLAEKLEGASSWMSKLTRPTLNTAVGLEKLGRGLRVAGGMATLAAAAASLAPAVSDLADNLTGFDEKSRQAALGTNDLDKAMHDIIGPLKVWTELNYDARSSLEQLVAVQAKGPFARWVGDILLVDRESAALAKTLQGLDQTLGSMKIDAASDKFVAYATSVGASDEQMLAMLKEMPELTAQLDAVAGGADGAATDQERLAYLLGRSAKEADDSTSALRTLARQSELTSDEVDKLSDAIRNFGDQQLDVRDTQRQYEQALDDLRDSLAENGAEFRLTEQAGRDNSAALDDGIRSVTDYAASIFDSTQDQEAANQALRDGKQALLEQLREFDPAGVAAGKYTDILNAIPNDITTVIDANTGPATQKIDKLIRDNNGRIIKVIVDGEGSIRFPNGTVARMASGAIAYGPRQVIVGDAGPEAIVPLNRPLSLVDPSVRALSAIAQGMPTPTMASGGIAGAGRVVNIEEGAIQIITPDPWRAATETVNRITERVVA